MSSVYSPAEDSFLLSSAIKSKISRLIAKNSNLKVLEIGSGSGIQLKTLFESGIKKQNIFSCDINPEAVKHCRKLGFSCVQSNLFEKISGKFNLILFNPPYLPEDSAEPKDSALATTGGKRGGEIINIFLQQAKKHLAKDGRIFLLTSSLTKGINWKGYKKKIIAKQKLFFEEIYVWENRLKQK
jgi:release factor glutamine methyltransferase